MLFRSVKLPKNKSFFLFGPRQTGKSTLLKSLFPAQTTLTYDLLNTQEYLRLSAHPSLFKEEVASRSEAITHVFVDEIQRVPHLLDEVHSLMESANSPYFILTGSSARKLKRGKANLLAGRALTYHLYPLMTEELGDRFMLKKVLQFGSLPSVSLEESEEGAAERLRSYVETYLREEIELEAQIRQIGLFVRFLTLAGHENGNMLNFSNIGRETGTNYQTVKSYFQILEDTLLGEFLFPYQKSQRKRLAQHPKFYFFDPGVVRALTKKLTVTVEQGTPDFGRAFEHFVILELMRKANYERRDWTFSYYRTEAGAEVDLIIETPRGDLYAVEIKGKDLVDSTDFRGLCSFREICPKAQAFCVSLSPRRREINNVTIVPWQEFLQTIS